MATKLWTYNNYKAPEQETMWSFGLSCCVVFTCTFSIAHIKACDIFCIVILFHYQNFVIVDAHKNKNKILLMLRATNSLVLVHLVP